MEYGYIHVTYKLIQIKNLVNTKIWKKNKNLKLKYLQSNSIKFY